MDRRAKRDLRLRIPAFVGLHDRPHVGRRRPRFDHGPNLRPGVPVISVAGAKEDHMERIVGIFQTATLVRPSRIRLVFLLRCMTYTPPTIQPKLIYPKPQLGVEGLRYKQGGSFRW
jgi:hypothetical protein